MNKKILIIILINIIFLTGCNNKNKEISNKLTKTKGMLSYTIDGEKTDIKPTKEEGYIVNKIICDNGSDMMWDNDNWEVELTEVNSKDRCKVDFTKETSKEGYRVTITSNKTSALDSLSKTTTLNGTVKIYSKSKIESVTGCNGVIENNKVIINNMNSNQTCYIKIEDRTLSGTIKSVYPPYEGDRPNVNSVYNGTPGLFTNKDNQGITYYFSGDGSLMNNWVSFAGKLWRIIRINGNGSIRLLYAGSGGEDGYIGTSKFNSETNDPLYAGWKYGSSGTLDNNRTNENNSLIYTYIKENWYDKLSNEDKNYIDQNAIYCNDRSIKEGSVYSLNNSFNFGTTFTAETALLCPDKRDSFTDGFGLITTNEIRLGGGNNNGKGYYYLAADGTSSSSGSGYWWTMDPANFYVNYKYIYTRGHLIIDSSISRHGEIYSGDSSNTNMTNRVRPVTSLKPEVIVTGGDGSGTNPYSVTLPN